MTDAGLRTLEGMKNLDMVSLYDTRVTSDGLDRLHKTIPKANLYH